MTRYTWLRAALGAACTPVLLACPAVAQEPITWRFGAGGGISAVSGFPSRNFPRDGETLVGAAGPEVGRHVKVFGERNFERLSIGGDLLYNRLTTGPVTGHVINGVAYPTADEDVTVSMAATVRYRVFTPIAVVVAFGAAHNKLSSEEDQSAGIYPMTRAGAEWTVDLFRIPFLLEIGLQKSFGRSSGSGFIPITLSYRIR